MSSSHHIDDLFKQQLKEHEIVPNDRVWNHIASQLDQTEQRGLFLWKRRLSIAATIALLISLSIGIAWLSNSNSTTIQNQQASNIDTSHKHQSESSQSKINSHTNTTASITATSLNDRSAIALTSEHTDMDAPDQIRVNMHPIPSLNHGMNTQTVNASKLARKEEARNTRYLPLTTLDESLTQQTHTTNSILIGAAASPSYSFRTLNDNQPNEDQQNGIDEKGVKSMTAALRVGYNKNNSRWHFESGLIFSKAGQVINSQVTTINSTFVNNNFAVALRSNEMLASNSMGSINIMESITETPVFLAPANPDNIIENQATFSKDDDNVVPQNMLSTNDEPIRINQILEYLEVPLMARYNVIQKNAIVSLAVGISTNMLINNSAYMTYNNVSSDLGETEAIDKISYSARFGLGIGVPIFKGIMFNMEPTFNYFLQPVNNQGTAEFRPYTIAVLTGFSYQF